MDDPRVDQSLCLHPLNEDELKTCRSIVRGVPECMDALITPMPTHSIDHLGRFGGFAFSCECASPISGLPLGRSTFHGHTAVECDASSADIIRLLSDVDSAREVMGRFLHSVRERSRARPVATFACRPDNVECVREGGGVSGIRSKRTIDSQDWVPEVPDSIGIYHSFVRGHNRDTRVHKLFIIASGGCSKAADEFYNVVLDCHGHATAGECAGSEEAWWLRRASFRSRCRLIAECAEAFGLRVNHIRDIHAHDSARGAEPRCGATRIAVSTIDTVTHDLRVAPGGEEVHVLDSCCDVNAVSNGILCSMHPSEGFWIFKGAQNRAQGSNAYGVSWHTRRRGAMGVPTSVVRINCTDAARKGLGCGSVLGSAVSGGRAGSVLSVQSTARDRNNALAGSLRHAVVSTTDSAAIVRIHAVDHGAGASGNGERPPEPERDRLYQFFDERYLSLLSSGMEWPRDRGIVELIPIVVGMGVVVVD